ncbi:hypothetical protein CDD80_2089 [Ophiocordyceps camponoti-rufipedis]|uniref:NADH-ubiquinone oxidoreductase 29.9 kDa subunit n=1 Tax=Ophiocordyceps camponoti-rufipedis TaxID=2004952 RepID=A0A2C5ZNW3_9HYPO|nr:hypothetical protein CDD80_2089 [Ophiocordyceps camponoti-rufipedis]
MWQTISRLGPRLEAGLPTGLTGLWTRGTPRSTLLSLYNITLSKLQSIPETSVYRQSVEALTRHRMGLVEQIKPTGHEQWANRARDEAKEKTQKYRVGSVSADGREARLTGRDGQVTNDHGGWHGQRNVEEAELEGIEAAELRLAERGLINDDDARELEDEPQLTAEQIAELEKKIGAGLIEEVIQVAEAELHLVDIMKKANVWGTLEEEPIVGQWNYFQR